MAKRDNRSELIVKIATRLFMRHGYAETSVRQIAAKVGCTEAALYYHFPNGKQELFAHIIQLQTPNLTTLLDDAEPATSLADLIRRVGAAATADLELRRVRFNWMASEFGRLGQAEQSAIKMHQMAIYKQLGTQVHRWIKDTRKASRVAWSLMCMYYGYGLLFWSMNMRSLANFTEREFAEVLAEAFGE